MIHETSLNFFLRTIDENLKVLEKRFMRYLSSKRGGEREREKKNTIKSR